MRYTSTLRRNRKANICFGCLHVSMRTKGSSSRTNKSSEQRSVTQILISGHCFRIARQLYNSIDGNDISKSTFLTDAFNRQYYTPRGICSHPIPQVTLRHLQDTTRPNTLSSELRSTLENLERFRSSWKNTWEYPIFSTSLLECILVALRPSTVNLLKAVLS